MKKVLLTLCLTGLLAGLAGADCCDGNAKKTGKLNNGWFTTHTIPGNPDCCKGLASDSADCCKNKPGGQAGCKGDCGSGGTCADKSSKKDSCCADSASCKDGDCGDKKECKCK